MTGASSSLNARNPVANALEGLGIASYNEARVPEGSRLDSRRLTRLSLSLGPVLQPAALGEPHAEWSHHEEPFLLIIAERWDALVVNSPRSLISIVERPLLKFSTRTLVPKMKC